MAHRAVPILTVHAVAIEKKWAHHRAIVQKAAVIGMWKVEATITNHVPIAKKAVDKDAAKGLRRVPAHATMPTRARVKCEEKVRAAVTARRATAMKVLADAAPTARREAMAHAANAARVRKVRHV